MADNYQQPGAVGESRRSERVADAQVHRAEPGTGHAQEDKSDAVPGVAVVTVAPTPPVPESPEKTTFFPGAFPLDLAPLDPARNGVLEALKRIERNTAARAGAAPAPRRAAANDAASNAANSVPARPIRAAGGRMAVPDGSGTSLRQQVYRVKRIERQVEHSLPPAPVDPGAPDAKKTADTPQPSDSPFQRHREKRTREKEADTTARKVVKQQAAATPDKPLTAEALRKMPLRNDNGQFLSRDEKAGMSQAELAQAKAREDRKEAQKEDKTDSLLGKLGAVAKDTLTNKGDATDGVGTAVGNAYYSAAKEAYGAYEELAGEGSKSRELYKWARGHWDKRKEGSAAATETSSSSDDEAAQQDAEKAKQDAAANRQQHDQASEHHDDLTEELEVLTKTNEDGFEEVVQEVKRIQGGGGSTIIPSRNPFRSGGGTGGRGGSAGGANPQRGRMGRLWDRVRSPFSRAPAAAASTAASAAPAAGGASRTARALGGSSRLLGAIAAPITAALAYSSTKNELAERSDLTDAQKTTTAAATGVGAGGGALAGAGVGAATGAAIGSVVPVIGTGIGGIIGGLIGGALGAWGGEKAGRSVGDAVASTMDNVEEEAGKALDEREKRLKAEKAKERKWYNPASWFSGGEGGGGNSPNNTQAARRSNRGNRGGSATSHVGDASLVERDDFGRVAEKYESGGRGVSTVSTGVGDAGGVSYGKHQLASKVGTMQAFLDSREGEAYREEFSGMQAGSNEFSAKYREVAERDADGFANAQQAFIARTHYNPVADYAAAKGMDTESEAIQEALYSQSVQHSGAGNRKIIDDAMSRVGEDASEDEVIDALYDARGDYASQFASPSATRDRYAREREDVRAISQANAVEAAPVSEAEAPQVAGANEPPASIRAPESAPTSPASQPPAMADSRPMTVEAALDYGVNGNASPVEPVLPSEPVTAIDDRQAAKAFHPTPSQPQPGASRRARREQASAPAASQRSEGNSTNPSEPRGATSAPGVNDIQVSFSDPVLTLMAMDRI